MSSYEHRIFLSSFLTSFPAN